MTIHITVYGDNARLTGPLSIRARDALVTLPGRRQWKTDGSLWFEASRANLDHLRARIPDAEWSGAGERFAELDALAVLEDVQRRIDDPASLQFEWKTPPFHSKQRDAFMFAQDRKFFGLFMEMGTGKTWVAINVAAHKWRLGEIDTLIVVAPNGVHEQWAEEQIPAHMPDWVERRVHTHKAGRKHPLWLNRTTDRALFVLCINAEALTSAGGKAVMERFMSGRHPFLVCDESIRFKNPKAKRTEYLLNVRNHFPCRAILSGAPITKGVEDLYSQMGILSWDIFGHSSFTTFTNRYCVKALAFRGAPAHQTKITGYRNMEELTARVDAHSFRVTKKECLDLPPKIYTTRRVDLTDEQRRAYTMMATTFRAELLSGRVTAANAAVKMMRLQQITCGHAPEVDEDGNILAIHPISSNRVQAVLDVLEESDAHTIIWARFKYDMKVLAEALREKGISFCEYHGGIPTRERQGIREAFQRGEYRVFLGNPAAAGTGLNLQRATIAIYYSNSFNADYRWQSEDRNHRIGQDQACTIIDFVTPNTIDAQILRALRDRKSIAQMVLDDPRVLDDAPAD